MARPIAATYKAPRGCKRQPVEGDIPRLFAGHVTGYDYTHMTKEQKITWADRAAALPRVGDIMGRQWECDMLVTALCYFPTREDALAGIIPDSDGALMTQEMLDQHEMGFIRHIADNLCVVIRIRPVQSQYLTTRERLAHWRERAGVIFHRWVYRCWGRWHVKPYDAAEA